MKRDQKISTIEAHVLWKIITSKYQMIDNVQLWYSFAHDKDLKKMLNDFLQDLDEHTGLIEKELQKFSIEGPPRPKKHARGNLDSQLLSDEIIAKNYFTFLQEMVELVLFSIQNSYYNDALLSFLRRFAQHAIEQSDNILKYLKLKGWLDIPPYNSNIPQDIDEQIGCAETFHLWTHTYYRYTNIEETQKWVEFVHDKDFKMLLKKGLKKLNKQVSVLEKELEHFGITTPKRPPNVVRKNQDQSIFQDEYVFRTLFIGLQWAGVLHSKAFQQCITNDRVRNIFKKYLYEEIDMLEKVVKYGKAKGWLNLPPEYIS